MPISTLIRSPANSRKVARFLYVFVDNYLYDSPTHIDDELLEAALDDALRYHLQACNTASSSAE